MIHTTQISVVVPLFNEEESLPELCAWIDTVMKANQFSYEVMLVDDGSKDGSWKVIEKLSAANSNIKGIRFNRNYGKSAALHTGFQHCVGKVVITMDADLQDSPDEIPGLYKMIHEEGYDLVSGWKKVRHDPITKTIPTKLFNAVTCQISGIKLHDFNCGLKAYKSEVVKSISVYGEMHRYIPVIAKWAGFTNIGEKVVQHQARKYGTTKFGLERFVYGFLDLLSITFVSKFSKRPMHFFGTVGMLCLLAGTYFIFALSWDVIYTKVILNQVMKRELVEEPFFFLALVSVIIGSQLFLTGYLGELFVRNNMERNEYLISKKVNIES